MQYDEFIHLVVFLSSNIKEFWKYIGLVTHTSYNHRKGQFANDTEKQTQQKVQYWLF